MQSIVSNYDPIKSQDSVNYNCPSLTCLKCNSTNICLECISGYTIRNGSCVEKATCVNTCKICEIY